MRYVCQQAAKPGTRFMRCSGNVTRHDERWQAVFVLRADVVRMLRINITWQLVIVCIVHGEGEIPVCGDAAGSLFTGAAVIVVPVVQAGSQQGIHRPHPVKEVLNI
ncbi:hypothetical protein G3863_004977 [Escherichia coli]|nr:hypothetical protein [Escherichia coli]